MPVKKRKYIKKKKDRKEHGNSSWDAEKRDRFIELIKIDITRKDALANVKLADSTLTDRLKRDEKLSAEYGRAKTYLDIKA